MSGAHLPSVYVLDTTVLSQLVGDTPDPATMDWLAGTSRGSLRVPAGAVYEVRLGIELARRNGNRRADRLERRLATVLADERFPVVPVDTAVACLRAVLAADIALRHLTLADPRAKRPAVSERLAIAATAIAAGAAVATLERTSFALIAGRHAMVGILDPSTGTWTGQGGREPNSVDGPHHGMPVAASARKRSAGAGRCNGSLTDSEDFRHMDGESFGEARPVR